MSYASDKLYREYLIRNMPTIVTKVKAREIVPYLPCLTDHDRETIEAKREMYGNYNSMVLLLDCLKRRENWPEQFIEALEACGHPTIAAEIRREYDALRGINNSSPSSLPTTVTRAHVHPTPSASHLPIPESDGTSQAATPAAAAAAAPPAEATAPPGAAAAPPAKAAAPPAEAAAPPEPAAQASPPLDVPVQPQAQVPEAVSPPEPVAEPPQSTQIEVAPAPSTPPPSPETPHTEVTTATPPPQREINSHQEPEENSESDIQDISGDNGVTAGNGDVSISSVDAPSCPDPLPTTTTATTTTTTEVRPTRSPSPTQIDSDVTDGSDFLLRTPEKPPVQDTTPPLNMKPAVVLQPEETSEPPATKVVERSPQTETAPASSPLPGAAGIDTSPCDDSDVCLSKPGHLVSIHPQNNGSPAIPAASPPAEPYSGNSDRLEISEAAPETVSSAHVPTCSAVSSTTEYTVSALPCQENGITLDHNEPEENFYESTGQSLGLQDVRENVVQISEEPSILNLDGQSSTPQAQIFNGEAAKEITCAPPVSSNAADTVSSVNTPSCENHHLSEPAPAEASAQLKTLQDSEKISPSRTLPANTKYILTAAGVGACALLMAWKFKN
ncbi:mitochondrial antiviral-signaling protein isoform X2 [Acanthopagrus latus]|uniref:mitochondrial antiviral-signaling protein isoform X2 n=1 Tax=Acanthopagrus latus TaxID=8177 RepID=UPI00187BE39E|nr:mitochondrial antiviral-signaling protein isoform X2 [Acanthopagrus latus]